MPTSVSTSKEIAITALRATQFGEHVVVAGEEREPHLLIAAIYTVSGDFERKIQLNETLNHIFFWNTKPCINSVPAGSYYSGF